MSRIGASRVECAKRGQDIHTSLMQKSLTVNRLLKHAQQFVLRIDELQWILKEGDVLMQRYLSEVSKISPHSSHTADMANIAAEFK